MREVLRRYQAHGVKLTVKKCEMFKDQVKFLGKIVSGENVGIPVLLPPIHS